MKSIDFGSGFHRSQDGRGHSRASPHPAHIEALGARIMTLPNIVYAQASPRSVEVVPSFDAGVHISQKTVYAVTSTPQVIQAAVVQLYAAGFEILSVTPVAINFAGSPDLLERAFRTKIVEKEVDLARG